MNWCFAAPGLCRPSLPPGSPVISASASSTILVGRQAIYDNRLEVYAYELLYRSKRENSATFEDANQATSQLLVNALVEIGLERITADLPAFVNFTREFIVGEYEIPFDCDQLVVEVLEDVPADEEVLRGLERLRERGFRIALDDLAQGDTRFELLSRADILKIDLRGYSRSALTGEVERFRKFPVQLLAEKVETEEEFEFCRTLGFDLFQGYFLSRPRVVEGKGLANNQLAILQILARLQDPEVSFEEVTSLIRQDLALSLKLLRYVNSATFGLRRQVESVAQVLTLLGLKKVRQIVSLIVVSGVSHKPTSLVVDALVRARMCENLANLLGRTDNESCFMAGLFSNLDLLLDRPLIEIVDQLPLADDIRRSLLHHDGNFGQMIQCVIGFEQGLNGAIGMAPVDPTALQNAYVEAISWVQGAGGVLSQMQPREGSPQRSPLG